MSAAKPLPKSLHTVTALLNVAANEQEQRGCPAEEAMECALIMLGYSPTADADPYGLAAKALAQLKASAK